MSTLLSFWNKVILSLCTYTGISLGLVTSIYTYKKYFLHVASSTTASANPVQGQPSQLIPLNVARYRRTVSSAVVRAVDISYLLSIPFAVVAGLKAILHIPPHRLFILQGKLHLV